MNVTSHIALNNKVCRGLLWIYAIVKNFERTWYLRPGGCTLLDWFMQARMSIGEFKQYVCGERESGFEIFWVELAGYSYLGIFQGF